MDDKEKLREIRKWVLISTIIPIYIVAFSGLLLGVAIGTVRLNYWLLVFPFLGKFLPIILIIYLFLYGIYLLYLWNKLEKIRGDIKEIIYFPKTVAILSFSFWIGGGLLVFLILYMFAITDMLTNVSIFVMTLGLSPLVAIFERFLLERKISEILSDHIRPEDFSKENLITDKLRRKIFYFVLASISVCLTTIIVLSAEILSREVKDKKAELYVDKYFRGEEIANQINWKIDKDGNVEPKTLLDEFIKDAIIYKLERGEHKLYDYLSSSVFIFSKREEVIEGILVPIPSAEKEAISLIFILVSISFLLGGIIWGTYYSSLGQYVQKALFSIGGKVWFGGDEFTAFSLEFITMSRKVEDAENSYNEVKRNALSVLTQTFSELMSIRAKLNTMLGEIRTVKNLVERVIQMTGKEAPSELETKLEESVSFPVEQLNSLTKKIRELVSVFRNIGDEFQNIKQVVDMNRDIGKEKYTLDGNLRVIETSLTKRMEMINNTIAELRNYIGKLSDTLKNIQGKTSEMYEFLKTIDEISFEIDGLKKRLFAISMNISIISGKVGEGEIGGELSSITKEISSSPEDLRKIETKIKDIGTQIKKYIEFISSDSSGDSSTVAVEGVVGQIDDIVDLLGADISSLISRTDNISREMKRMSDTVDNIRGTIEKISETVSNIGRLYASSSEDIEKISQYVGEVTKQFTDVYSKTEKLLREYREMLSKYKTFVSDVVFTLKDIRGEILKVKEYYERAESYLSKTIADIEKNVEVIQDVIFKMSS